LWHCDYFFNAACEILAVSCGRNIYVTESACGVNAFCMIVVCLATTDE
jgi:hypothetical protein